MEINLEKETLTLDEGGKYILSQPKVRFFLRGEPGIGKSSIMVELQKHTGYPMAYIDCPNLDLGDTAMPVIDHETKTTGYYPNARFKLHLGENKPVIIMLDEFTKAADPVKNMLHPLLEQHNPRLGDIPVPEGSIVFLTGNLDSDGVGDALKKHSQQRVVEVVVSKPTHEEWLPWAAMNGCNPIVMAWVNQYPHCLASYLDGDQGGNQFIFHPDQVQKGVVSPRTLIIASHLIDVRDQNSPDALIVTLAGAVGKSAAHSMVAYISHQDKLPTWDSIITSPTSADVPDEAGALAVLVFGGIEKVEKDTLDPFLKYLKRADPEWQSIFCINLARHKAKSPFAFASKAFTDWVQENEDLL